VLLDVRMPGMDGIETARRLLEGTSDAVVVLISLEAIADLPSSVGAAVHMRKHELSMRSLRRIWALHGGPRA
jgi:CheY-like chemotaxis protein